VFSQAFVADSMGAWFVPVKIDASRDFALAQQLGVRSMPTDVILTPQGQIVQRLGCPQDAGQYVAQLRTVMDQYARARAGLAAPAQPSPQPPYADAAYGGVGGPSGSAANRDPGAAQAQQPSYQASDYRQLAGPLGRPQPPELAQTRPPIADNRAQGQPSPEIYPPGGPPSGDEYPARPGGEVQPVEGGYRADYPPAAERPAQPYPPQDLNSPGGGPVGEPIRGPDEYGSPSYPNQPTGPAIAPNPPSSVEPPSGPAGAPPLGLEGHCPVTLIEKNAWEKGNPKIGAIHRGRTYLFVGPEEQRRFLERPDAYSPVLSGNDAVEFVDHGRLVTGTRRHGLEYHQQIYLFATEASLERFAKSPRRYAISVFQAMQQAPSGQTSREERRDHYAR
jgi:YHS domain-containing protein